MAIGITFETIQRQPGTKVATGKGRAFLMRMAPTSASTEAPTGIEAGMSGLISTAAPARIAASKNPGTKSRQGVAFFSGADHSTASIEPSET